VEWQQLFVAWGIAWWVLTFALVVVSFALVACKRGAYFLLSLVVYLGLLQFLGSTPVLEFVQTHFLPVACLVAGFLGIGVVWFNWRWHTWTSSLRSCRGSNSHRQRVACGLAAVYNCADKLDEP
jgi:hypothetical protein